MKRALSLLALAGAVAACEGRSGTAQAAERLDSREERLADRMTRADTTALAKWVLPRSLGEVSGLALTEDERLLAHDDELGRVTAIAPRTGVLLSQFMLGDRPAMDDFEGITVARGMIYMLTSHGKLYAFREGRDGARVQYTVHDTRLGHECEFEGVVFDPRTESLVLPCKTVHKKRLRDQLVLYHLRLAGPDAGRLALTTVPMARVADGQRWKTFHPSDITIDPATGDYVLVSAMEESVMVLTRDGAVALVRRLPGDHPRAEGVAITRDRILIVSDEAARTRATLTLYRWPLATAEGDIP